MSEPETKAVSSFIESKKENIACFLTMHSYGQLILVPYGYTKNKSNNHEELVSPYTVPEPWEASVGLCLPLPPRFL